MLNQKVLRIDISSRKRSFEAVFADHIDANQFYKLTLLQMHGYVLVIKNGKWVNLAMFCDLQCSGRLSSQHLAFCDAACL